MAPNLASPGDEPHTALPIGNFPPFEPGSVWLVGAGPGAPGLMTLLGYYGLQNADTIVYDGLVNDQILRWAQHDVELIFAGKRGGRPSAKQQDICDSLVSLARQNKRVLRLKGGDPMVFGRGGEECQALSAAGISFRIVPGITAGIGGLAYAGFSATHRDTNQALTFVTGHDAKGDVPGAVNWAVLASLPVLVIYMASRNLNQIARKLLDHGRAIDDPVAIISNATLKDQSVEEYRLGDLLTDADPIAPQTPAILVIGEIVTLRPNIDWFTDSLKHYGMG